MQDCRSLLAEARRVLAAAGIEPPDRDAIWLLAAAAGHDHPGTLDRHGKVDAATASRYAGLIRRRADREPVSRILGRRGFWSLDLAVTCDVLDPRPDSETLVAGILARLPAASSRPGAGSPSGRESEQAEELTLVDLGTGSGCLLLALLAELPTARGLGIDLSAAAVGVARRNAVETGLADRAAFVRGDWSAALSDHCVDILVSNPPYIASAALAGLMPEVRNHDPATALDGGPAGLDAYRRIVPDLPRVMRAGGICALEVDGETIAQVRVMLDAAGAFAVHEEADLAGRQRALFATW